MSAAGQDDNPPVGAPAVDAAADAYGIRPVTPLTGELLAALHSAGWRVQVGLVTLVCEHPQWGHRQLTIVYDTEDGWDGRLPRPVRLGTVFALQDPQANVSRSEVGLGYRRAIDYIQGDTA